ncbi:putative uncharacterized protein DDB_G0277255 [Rhagoletis pomonella]|uniref:putative uncharacterized protein DDB_G0277255 n=1 Tax=Rhagoletis pomonella TaxID=28610 RepID=UPI00177EF9FC|nr:putative uncharacterized protein DDB_G0277255 [Rhagoletis pomonella]
MMEDCQTPTLAEVMEFKYEVTPTMVFDSSCLQETHNLIVNRISVRCFTPTIKNFQSPGLSPITEGTQTLVNGVAVEGIPISMPMMSNANNEIFKASKNPKGTHQKSALPLQQQQQQQQPCQKSFSNSHFVSDSPPIFTLNSTTISDTDFSIEIASPDSAAILGSFGNNNNNNNSGSNSNNSSSDSDKLNATFTNKNNNNNGINASKNLSNTNLLDRTMNVSTLLRSVGLEQYVEAFEEQNLDLEQFLKIRTEDFQRLGVTKAKHQKKLLDLLSELNGAEI